MTDLAPLPDATPTDSAATPVDAAVLASRLYRIGETLTAERDLQRIIQVVTDEATALSGAKFGAFFYNVLDAEGKSYMLYALSGAPREAFERFPMPRATAVFAPTFHGEGIVRSADIMRDPRYGHSPPYHGMPAGHLPVRSYLAVPVVSRTGEVLGGLFFGHPDTGVFTEVHEQWVAGLAGWAAVAMDNARLFEQGRAELEERQVSEARLRIALDTGRLGAWEWVIGEDRVQWSETLEQIHGLEPGGFAGTFEAYQRDIHPEDRERVLATIAASVRGENEHHLEYRIVRPDGEVRWLEARGRLLHDSSGKPERLVGVCTDVTERKRDTETLRFLSRAGEVLVSSLDYEQTLQSVARLAVPTLGDWCAIDILDGDGTLRRVAVAHVDPLKVELAHELRRRYPDDRDAPRGLYNVLRTGRSEYMSEIPEAMIVEAARDDEHLRILRELGLRSYLSVPLIGRGEVVGVFTLISAESGRRYGPADVALVEDLARRAAAAIDNARLHREVVETRDRLDAARAVAEEANKAKSDFLASMSHELRTPLNAIGGYAQLLLLGVRGEISEAQRIDLERIVRSQEHLLALVNDVLNFARLEAGHVRFDARDVPVNDLLVDLETLTRPQLATKSLLYECTLGEPSVMARVDPERAQQVILNLISNAIKYTEPGGRITVSWEAPDRRVLIRVRDTGRGIPSDKLETIFDPFVQLARAPSRVEEGVGLGLAISRDIARAMDGDVTVTSQLGQGSVFTFEVPRA